MILAIGEILFDHYPSHKRLGGAPFNFAFHLKRFGLPVRFISRVGDDAEGIEILDFLSKNDFDVNDIQVDKDHATGHVDVTLDRNHIPSFDIARDVAYDYLDASPVLDTLDFDHLDMIYFGSLLQRRERGFKTLQSFLATRKKQTTTLFDINLRLDAYRDKALTASLGHTDCLKLNQEELGVLKTIFRRATPDPIFSQWLLDRYALTWLALTKGEDGATLYLPDRQITVPPVRALHLRDTVGAGDAFAAMLAAGHCKGWPVEQTLAQASEFAAAICETDGAIPAETQFYNNFCSNHQMAL